MMKSTTVEEEPQFDFMRLASFQKDRLQSAASPSQERCAGTVESGCVHLRSPESAIHHPHRHGVKTQLLIHVSHLQLECLIQAILQRAQAPKSKL